ncbi:sigma-54-dependent Fis family transcriptional regulator [Imhoffiella purpurea]|uniref:Transcriptional regulator acoR n=1 Tax=Imhoffiella purpurea TaxID=1249627 RepID=W9V927_9GAMM|nr:sigma-54-dependent Fis family transcriptional regulator [Imhoffiella purpurea]EXJ15934.1 transcriptional regulator acoR [Imhoffiella purpurea]
MGAAIMRLSGSEHAALVKAGIAGDAVVCEQFDAMTVASWRRCFSGYGLDPIDAPDPVVVPRADLRERQEQSCRLLEIARHEMSDLYQQLAGSGHAIILTDREGVLLNYIGDPIFTDTAANVRLQTGAVWDERTQGTNAIGTCLVEKKPLVVHKTAHYLLRNARLTCAAAPILDPHGNLLAILDASSEAELAQKHTMVLLNMSAQMIENRVFFCAMKEAYVFRCHSRAEFIGTLGEGLVAFTPDGRVLAANRSAIFQMGLDAPQRIVGREIQELFAISLPMLLERAHSQSCPAFPIIETRSERRFFAKVQAPEKGTARTRATASRHRPRPAIQKAPDSRAPFERLHLGDPRMQRNIETVTKVLGRDLPCLLLGETGVGKDVFARAMHQASARRDRPFVALNCASLPESLIESELFGYRPGAFTGASRDGSRGKILQADGGTLFLDEIGDMPIDLQARLLQVLEDRRVVPLGGETPIPVSIQLISATHRDVRALIAEGRFREDLYYRINGISIQIPPLRDRRDRRELILALTREESGDGIEIEWEAEALERMLAYPWPGNLRQLRNILRAATALCEDQRIRTRDLPEEIRYPERAPDRHDRSARGLGTLAIAEREALLELLEDARWNVSRVAKNLGLSRNTLYRRMKRYGIEPAR